MEKLQINKHQLTNKLQQPRGKFQTIWNLVFAYRCKLGFEMWGLNLKHV
jgi:hypothetical protein